MFYWKRKFEACEKERRRYRADAKCARGLLEQAEEEVHRLRDVVCKQAVFTSALERTNADLRVKVDALEREAALKDDLIRSLKFNQLTEEMNGEETRDNTDWKPT